MPSREDVIKAMHEFAEKMFEANDAVFVVVSCTPGGDSEMGEVLFTRRGVGPAYQLALRALESEIDLSEPDVSEIYPEDMDE